MTKLGLLLLTISVFVCFVTIEFLTIYMQERLNMPISIVLFLFVVYYIVFSEVSKTLKEIKEFKS